MKIIILLISAYCVYFFLFYLLLAGSNINKTNYEIWREDEEQMKKVSKNEEIKKLNRKYLMKNIKLVWHRISS